MFQWRTHCVHIILCYMYLTRTKPNTFIYKYLEVDSGGIYMFTHVDWAHMVMVLALPGKAERCLQRGGCHLFHTQKNKLARENWDVFFDASKESTGVQIDRVCACVLYGHMCIWGVAVIVPVSSEILACLSAAIDLIGPGGRSYRQRKSERCCRQDFQTTPSPKDRRLWLPVPPLPPPPPPWLLLPSFMSSVFCFVSLFFPTPPPLLTHPASTPPASPLCLSLTRTAEALMTFHSSIRHIQHWSISTLSPLHSTTPGLKMSPVCLCQYLSICWQGHIRLVGGWLFQ